MNNNLYYVIFPTVFGWVGCLGSKKGLRKVTLPHPSPQQAMDELGEEVDGAIRSYEEMSHLVMALTGYFNREHPDLDFKLDYAHTTPFQQAVWTATRSIPYGQTQSYAWIAKRIGKPAAVRAVGQALGKNPLAIIVPCHRVLASDGGLCGFGGGLEMKRRLLDLESRIPGR